MQEREYDCFVVYKSLSQLVSIRMSAEESPNEFSDGLEVAAEYVEAEIGEPLTFINLMAPESNIKTKDIDRTTSDFLDERKALWERFKAFLLIKRSYRPKYGSIALKLLQQYALNTDQYPKTMDTARRVLESHHPWDEGWNKVKQQRKEAASHQQSASNNQRLPSTNMNDNSMISPPGEISLNQMESRCF
jgi:hypothetical protein